MIIKKTLTASLILTVGSAISACKDKDPDPSEEPEFSVSNCFWAGPYVKENPITNIAYPDRGAVYWSSRFSMPSGSRLELKGQYMYNRYMSFNSYDVGGTNPSYKPVDAISDSELMPDNLGAVNPYRYDLPQNERNSSDRDYTIEVLTGSPATDDPENTLRSNADFGEFATIVLRSYVADSGEGLTAGVPLPTPVVTLEDGQVIDNVEEVCEVLTADSSIINVPLIPPGTYDQMTAFGNPYKVDATEQDPAVLLKAFTFAENINCLWFGACSDTPDEQPGFYANLDNQYVLGITTNARPTIVPEEMIGIDSDPDTNTTPLGKVTVGFTKDEDLEVAVFRGKLPETPSTYSGAIYAEPGELRYWSFCTNEYMSQKVTDCLYDEQVQVDEDGYYTIAISWAEDRPINANRACGFNWLPTSTRGDGYLDILEQEVENGELDASELTALNQLNAPRSNNIYQNLVLVRNMLPSDGFENAIQSVSNYAETESVMGEYAVTYWYESKSDFESRGCL